MRMYGLLSCRLLLLYGGDMGRRSRVSSELNVRFE